MVKYIPTFGVEIHAELNTKSKAFSSAKVDFSSSPNSNVSPVDVGYPGAKPTVNIKMVEYAYRLAKILDMNIEKKLYFDRKNYFYPDLPKGFQITQYFKPIGTNGVFKILLPNKKFKNISIKQIHMEEDTAKQIMTNDGILFDFNRSGIPLIEIVSGHEELSSIDEVVTFVRQLKEQLIIMGINNGKMEEGSFRVDVNVSVRKNEKDEYGTRTEIKNLNSFKNIRKALEEEIKRQEGIYNSNKNLESTTVKFDEKIKKTIPIRNKNSNLDYNFIPEGNIIPITLTKELINKFNNKNDVKIWNARLKLLKDYQENSIDKILSSKELFDWAYEKDNHNLFSYLNNNNHLDSLKKSLELSFNIFKKKIDSKLKKVINFRNQGKINSKETNNLIEKVFKNEADNDINLLENKNLMSSEKIKNILLEIIKENKDIIERDKIKRPERVEKMIMGKLRKQTNGQASPQVSIKLVKEVLWEE